MAHSTSPLNIAIAGASGRMGQMLIEAVRQADDLRLSGALDVPSSPGIGNDATENLLVPNYDRAARSASGDTVTLCW